jgi:hypothetical protein
VENRNRIFPEEHGSLCYWFLARAHAVYSFKPQISIEQHFPTQTRRPRTKIERSVDDLVGGCSVSSILWKSVVWGASIRRSPTVLAPVSNVLLHGVRPTTDVASGTPCSCHHLPDVSSVQNGSGETVPSRCQPSRPLIKSSWIVDVTRCRY